MTSTASLLIIGVIYGQPQNGKELVCVSEFIDTNFNVSHKKMDLRGNNQIIDSCDFYNHDLSVKLLIWKLFHMGHMEQKSQQYG